MISFRETLDAVERQFELLRAVSDVAVALDKALEGLRNFRLMLEHSHEKQFESVDSALEYIDKVLIPQLISLHDGLQTSIKPPLQKLSQARAQSERLVTQLRTFSEGAPDLLP
jgi:hypothetical protein